MKTETTDSFTRQIDAQHAVGFDMESVEAALGEAAQDLEPGEYGKLADALRKILAWSLQPLVSPGTKKPDAALRRFVAVCWAMNPDLFNGAPSLRKLARRLNTYPERLAEQTGAARRTFGLSNKASAHAHNFIPTSPKIKHQCES